MKRYKLMALTNALEGRDDEFGRWYDEQHIPDVLSIPGLISAERFKLVGQGQHRYMTLYDIETDSLDRVMAELSSRPGTDLMPITDAIDGDSAAATVWAPIVRS